jgi:hypothetical protein
MAMSKSSQVGIVSDHFQAHYSVNDLPCPLHGAPQETQWESQLLIRPRQNERLHW